MQRVQSAFRSKNELVCEELRRAIIREELKPGVRLVIDELAEEMGVSQIPIREALRQLEAAGFVKFEPHIGATVTEISADLIFEVFALLEAMEVICSRTACQRMNNEHLETLATLINEMECCLDDADLWSEANKRLHQFICESAGVSLIAKMMQIALDHWDRLRLHYLQDVFTYRIRVAHQEHKSILEAFRTRDPDLVERVIRAHNRSALEAYIAHLEMSAIQQPGKA